MNVLSATNQQQVEDTLVSSDLLTAEQLATMKEQANSEHVPLLSYLVKGGNVSNEALTKIIANINKVPYVNLTDTHIDAKTLALLPQDIANRYMAVPLGEMQNQTKRQILKLQMISKKKNLPQ